MRNVYLNIITAALIVLLFFASLAVGSVNIPLADTLAIITGHGSSSEAWLYIVLHTRLPQSVTALLTGAALAVSGLLLQTAFRNPLAGPSVFGVNSGASLGVAAVMLLSGGSLSLGGLALGRATGLGCLSTVSLAVTGASALLLAAILGAALVMALLLAFAARVRSNVALLVVGIMVGYLASAAIALLNFFATDQGVHSYVVWGLGSFGGLSLAMLPLFAAVIIIGLLAALLLIKPLNALLLGEQYAQNLGIRTHRLRNILLAITGLLAATTTAFCGPIMFIGLAVPHMARLMHRTDNHLHIIPATMLAGAATALLCLIISSLPSRYGIIPINAITPLIGAPVIIHLIMNKTALFRS